MKLALALAFGIAIGAGAVLLLHPLHVPEQVVAQAAPAKATPVIAAAQGRVEGRGENIDIEASADGVISRLLAREGQRISSGDIVAEIACEDLSSQTRALEASLESVRQSRVRLLRGTRDEERHVADEEVNAAQAVVNLARRQDERMQYLASLDDVPKVAAETAKRDLETAEAALKVALEKQKLANAGPLPEETSRADAEVSAAQERLRAASAQRDKCQVRSPIDGTITRIHLRAGEAVSTAAPRPIMTIADLSERRIRAEVDERDLPKVHVGQGVRITAEGFPQGFGGRVTWTAVVMGRKTARSTDPAERSDRDILETLIVPDPGTQRLPLGLRVTVGFLRE